MASEFKIRVPASSSNLGSGFDTISAALSLHLHVQATRKDSPGIDWNPPWKGENALESALNAGLAKTGTPLPGLRIRMKNDIPLRRGLGSSAAAIIAGIRLAGWLSGNHFDNREVLETALPLEGHPDNLAASLLGGFVISRTRGPRVDAETLPSRLKCRFVVAIPSLEVATADARRILPRSYESADVVFNLQRCALLIHAIESGRPHLLREAMRDALHQPYRCALVAGASELLDPDQIPSRLRENWLGTAISGSGSTLVALAAGDHEEIGNWMVTTLAAHGTEARFLTLDLDREGAR